MEEKQNKGEREKLAESFVMWVKKWSLNQGWNEPGLGLNGPGQKN